MEEKLTKKEGQNWLKCMFATSTTRDVISQLADIGFKAFYTYIRSDIRVTHGILETSTCSSCSNPSKQCRLCLEIGHHIWDNHRFKKAKLKGPSWSNTDSTKWCTNYWELAKCYMPPTGYRDKPNANSTDFNGIIGAIYNCTWMQCYFTDDLSKDSNICTKAREEVNKLRHLEDTVIDDGDMINFFDCLLNLLNDPAHLHCFKPAADARIYLKQLQQAFQKVYDDRKEEFRGSLIQFYTLKKATVSVSPLKEGRHDKPIWDVFVQPKLSHVTIEKDGSRQKTENAVHSYKDLFYKDEKLNRRVFVQGEPGMGKTTFLTKLALDWCDAVSVHNPDYKSTFRDVGTLKEFRFLFQITLRDAVDQRDVIEMIKTQIIDMIYTGDKREDTVKLLQQILERETCIITMDGLNEWVDRLNKCITPLMPQCLTKCVSLITTRPWKMADERIKDSDINILIEIEGIIDAEELAKKITHSLQTGNVKTHTGFMTYVNERQLRHFLVSPWRLTLLVNLWMNYDVTGSLCEINCILLDILFKNANASKGYFQNGTSFQCLANTRFIKHQIDIFDALANAAFSLTFSSNKCVVFTERELLNYMSEVQLDFCLRAGVLTKRYSSTIAYQDAHYSFVHETVQEFLAAYHIANSNQDLIERFQTDLKYNVLEMSETIIYLCGLESKKANTLINRLADVKFLNDINHGLSRYVNGFLGQKEILAFQTDNNTERNVLKSEMNSMDYDKRCLALSVLFQRMTIAGYIEAKASGEKEIFLNCTDFTFNANLNESDSNALKMLLLSNKSDVRSLILESNVLQTNEILTVMQHSKHSLERVMMTVTPEINKALYHTSIQEVRYIGKFDVSFVFVFPPLSKLTFLGIDDSTFSEDIVLPDAIQHISFVNCTCTAVFLRRLLVRLSALKHDVQFDLITVSVTECNTHIFKQELLSSDMKNVILAVNDGNIDLDHLIRCSSIGKLYLGNAACASLSSEILQTLYKLTTLYLWGTYTGRCDLKLPASLQCIMLVNSECSSEWLCSLLITLSSLDHPVECELWDVVLQSSGDTIGDELNTHVSDLRSEILSNDMSDIKILVENGSKELFEILRDTSIEILGLRTADSASLASEILHTLKKLTKLYLSGTYTGQCDLKLPSSLQCISLQKVKCSSEWLCSLLITLSSLDHPVECEPQDVVLQSSGDTIGDELNTHVSDLRSEILSNDMSNIEILVKNGSKELFEILRDTSIGILSLITADSATLASDILHTLNKLTKLYLRGSYTGRCDRKLPASLQCISLQECECSSEWLCSLLITLSSLDHPVTCELWDVVLQSSGDTLGDEFNTHVSDLRSEILSNDMSYIKILVNNGSKELFEILRDTSIGILSLRTADCASLASEILHTLNKLTKLYLWGTYTGRCDLKLPDSLQSISLKECECSSEWLCSLLITLSSLDHPVTFELQDVVLQSSGDTIVDEFNTHVSDLRSEILSNDMSYIKILVNNGSKELFEILRDTSIGILDLITADSASLASEILHTLNKLTKLYLRGTYTGRYDLNMPASLQVISLHECECSSEWLCSLLITLSSLDHPVECELWDVVLQSSGDTIGDELNTHVSDLRSEILSNDMSNIEILVKNGSTELFEILRDTSIGSLKVITDDTSKLETVTRTKLNMIKQIYIEGNYLTRFNHDFPQSLELLYLTKGNFSLEWLYSVLIRLSQVNHHVQLDVEGLLISSYETCPPSSKAHVIQCEYSNNVIDDSSNTNLSDFRSEMLTSDMSNIELCIINFHQERFDMLQYTNIRSVQLTALDDASLTFVTQNTLPAFKEIRLQGTYLSDFNHKLTSTLQLLILEKGTCSSDWLYSLLIQLSTLRHSVRVYLSQYGVLQRRESCEKHPESPMRGADLFNVKLEVLKDCLGLYETLTTMHITSLNMTQIEHADMLSQTLPLTHLQKLRICLKKYDMDMKLPECIKYVFIIYKTFSPSSLIHFVQNLSTTEHIVQCKLVFRVEECEDEYTRIKQEYCESKSLDVQQFELINKQGKVRGAAALTLSATADDGDDDADKHLLRREGEYVDSKPWIHYCKIRFNILCPDNSEGDS